MIQVSPNITTVCPATVETESLTEIVVVCACDDNYAMPLAVMLFSAASRLSPEHYLNVYFLDGGLREESWVALKETLCDLPITIHAIEPDYSVVEDLKTSHHVTPAAYLRLLSADLLPKGIEKAIYLDSDLLIMDDLAKLWDLPLHDNFVLACPDIACPFVDAKAGCDNYKKASPYLASLRPIPNYQELELDAGAEYFNSGVMILNLDVWRQEDVGRRMLDCLEEHHDHVWCWDQYALNVVFHGRWGRLEARWNQGAHALEFPSANHSPICEQEFAEMLENPAIVHFTTEFKPWHFHWQHLRGDLFFDALDQTSFKGWRPTKPEFKFDDWWSRTMVSLIKHSTIHYRRFSLFWSRS